MESKKKLVISIIAAAVLLIAVAAGFMAYKSSAPVRLNKQLVLGNKYLLEEDFEQAIAAFAVAIEIDPMSVEAYMGLVDAYMELENYEEAIAALEKGIKVLSEAGHDDDANILQTRLSEVQDKLEEKERLEANDEAAKAAKEEQEKNMQIELQALYDVTHVIWGKNWQEWTIEGFASEYNLEFVDEGNGSSSYVGGDFFINNREESYKSICETKIIEGDASYVVKAIDFHGGEKSVRRTIWNNKLSGINEDDCIQYCKANGLVSIESVAEYLGIDGILKEGEGIDIITDMGKASVYLEKIQGDGPITMLRIDNIENQPGLVIAFMGFGSQETGGESFDIYMKE